MEPAPELLVHSSFDDTAVRRACLRGDLVRLVTGRYVRASHWAAWGARERHVMRAIAAVSCLRTPAILSHSSAAAVWGLPRLGGWPDRIHAIDPRLARATATAAVQKHAGDVPLSEVREHSGLLVTSPARTAVDIALASTFRQAVVALDHGLREELFTRDDLQTALARQPGSRGQVKARRAIDFADGLADRPGESLSRVVMQEAGLARPELQHVFTNPYGKNAVVDFWWEKDGIVGEFDGEVKYRDRGMRAGRSPEDVVIDEKDRENWVRARREVRGFVRWTWRDAFVPGRLARVLVEAGVPRK